MAKTNYDNIDGKSVWDLYVENFLTGLWDLAPKFAWDENGIRVVTDEEISTPPKPKKKKTKSKTTDEASITIETGMTKTGRVGDKPVDGLTQPPIKVSPTEKTSRSAGW